jgi:hypothetical protein
MANVRGVTAIGSAPTLAAFWAGVTVRRRPLLAPRRSRSLANWRGAIFSAMPGLGLAAVFGIEGWQGWWPHGFRRRFPAICR